MVKASDVKAQIDTHEAVCAEIMARAKDLAVSFTVIGRKSPSLKCRCQSSGRDITISFTMSWRYTIFWGLSS